MSLRWHFQRSANGRPVTTGAVCIIIYSGDGQVLARFSVNLSSQIRTRGQLFCYFDELRLYHIPGTPSTVDALSEQIDVI